MSGQLGAVIWWPGSERQRLMKAISRFRIPSHCNLKNLRLPNGTLLICDEEGNVLRVARVKAIVPKDNIRGADGSITKKGYVLQLVPGSTRKPRGKDVREINVDPSWPGTLGYFDEATSKRVRLSEIVDFRPPAWNGVSSNKKADRKKQTVRQFGRKRLRKANDFPDELNAAPSYAEGASKQVLVNSPERNLAARKSCIRRHGVRCAVCSLSFEVRYGKRGKGFIHIHHMRPLARSGQQLVEPEKDLVPVCPNCHAMIHRGKRMLTINGLRRLLRPISDDARD